MGHTAHPSTLFTEKSRNSFVMFNNNTILMCFFNSIVLLYIQRHQTLFDEMINDTVGLSISKSCLTILSYQRE